VAHAGDKLVLVLACDLEIFGGFGKFEGSRLHLLEQPRVLDGDHCLVSKSFEQLDLSFREMSWIANDQ
jgi:hypothetical protein